MRSGDDRRRRQEDRRRAATERVFSGPPPPPIGPPEEIEKTDPPRAEPGLLGNVWAIIGIVMGFFLLVVPGVFAIRSYRRWHAGKAARPTFAWICAWVGILPFIVALSLAGTYKGPILEDDFADPTSGWPVRSDATSSVGYVDGEYAIALTEASRDQAGFIWDEGPLPSVNVDVIGRIVEGPGERTSIGIACVDHEASEGYLFAVSNLGYAILRWNPDGVEDLASGPLNLDITRRHLIRGICFGGDGHTSLTMVLDGHVVAEVSPEGTGVTNFTAVLLVAGTDGDDPIEARFDDVSATPTAPF